MLRHVLVDEGGKEEGHAMADSLINSTHLFRFHSKQLG